MALPSPNSYDTSVSTASDYHGKTVKEPCPTETEGGEKGSSTVVETPEEICIQGEENCDETTITSEKPEDEFHEGVPEEESHVSVPEEESHEGESHEGESHEGESHEGESHEGEVETHDQTPDVTDVESPEVESQDNHNDSDNSPEEESNGVEGPEGHEGSSDDKPMDQSPGPNDNPYAVTPEVSDHEEDSPNESGPTYGHPSGGSDNDESSPTYGSPSGGSDNDDSPTDDSDDSDDDSPSDNSPSTTPDQSKYECTGPGCPEEQPTPSTCIGAYCPETTGTAPYPYYPTSTGYPTIPVNNTYPTTGNPPTEFTGAASTYGFSIVAIVAAAGALFLA
jgi:hypothetical protein